MGRLYSCSGDQTAAAAASLLTIQSQTSIKPQLLDLTVGSGAAPADQSSVYNLYRFDTDDGTGTSATAEPLDPDDPATLTSAQQSNHTGEPSSKGNTLLRVPLHQRGIYRWVAAPGRGFYANNVATEGLGFQFLTTTMSVDSQVTFVWEE